MRHVKPTEAQIVEALNDYRKAVSRRNHRAMSIMMPQIETIKPEGPDFDTPEEEEEARMDYLYRLFDINKDDTRPRIERPTDVLKHYDVLAPQLSLDGCSRNHDPEWRATRREAYKTGILQGLSKFECPDGEWTFPPDLEVVMQHVDSLEGNGWPMSREFSESYIFWNGWGPRGGTDSVEDAADLCKSGKEIHEEFYGPEEYDIAAGFVCGSGNACMTHIIYCRLKEDTVQDWSWRYVAWMGEFGDKVYDDLVAFLKWYQDYGIPGEDDIKNHAEMVFF